jgi:hypothetical protein
MANADTVPTMIENQKLTNPPAMAFNMLPLTRRGAYTHKTEYNENPTMPTTIRHMTLPKI